MHKGEVPFSEKIHLLAKRHFLYKFVRGRVVYGK